MAEDGKEECPVCGKRYKNLDAHTRRMHSNGTSSQKKKGKKRKKSTDALEDSLAQKLLSKNKKNRETTVEDILDEDSDKRSKKELDKEREQKKKELKKVKPTFIQKIDVDYWLTNLHDAEVGVYQKERFMAKNRQFSRNLELVGAVEEDGKADGMFGYMSDSWDRVPLKDMAKRRLVLKWFNSKSISWLGTIEEVVISSMISSIGSNDSLPSFKLVIPRYKYVINLNKEHTKIPKMGEIFTFAVKDEKDDRWHIFSFDEDRFTIGSDWSILYGDNELVGKIDEKVVNIGGKFEIEIYSKRWYKFKPFLKVVILFTMMLRFNREIQHKIKKLREYVDSGKVKLDISAAEEKFLMNPRALKR